EEVAGSGDDRVRLAAGARNRLAQERVGAPRDRVRVAEGGEERLLPAAEHLPRPAVRRRRRIVGRGRDEQREAPRPGLVALVGKGCVVGSDHLRRELGDATGLDDAADWQLRRLLRVALPGEEGGARRAVAGREEGVGGDDPREPFRMLRGESQADEPAQALPTSVPARRFSASSPACLPSAWAREVLFAGGAGLSGRAEAAGSGGAAGHSRAGGGRV